MNTKQTTIQKPITVSGVGLHTGSEVNLTFKPAPENHGIKFQRIDVEGKPIIEADVDNVVDLSRGTTIGKNGIRVGTIEHVMAALAGLQIDNVLMEIDAPETPIMDGSALPFIKIIHEAGIQEQYADREYFEIPSNIHYSEPDRKVEMMAMPQEDCRYTVMVDYNSSVLGSQHASIADFNEFESEIAGSRTFCFLHELEALMAQNLIKGGDLNNAIVIVDRPIEDEELQKLAKLFNKETIEVQSEGILNNIKLRYQNEPARHKLLDLIGDLSLIGAPLKAHVMAARPGHAANIAFAKKIKNIMRKHKRNVHIPKYDVNQEPIYDNVAIQKLLPHADPFLLVDKIIELSDKHIVGIKNVTIDQPFFRGHFPGNPILPGVLQIETMAQTGGAMILSGLENPGDYETLFMKIDNCKFKEKVVPGDTLIIKAELKGPMRRSIVSMKCQIFVGTKMVTEAELMAQIAKKN